MRGWDKPAFEEGPEEKVARVKGYIVGLDRLQEVCKGVVPDGSLWSGQAVAGAKEALRIVSDRVAELRNDVMRDVEGAS